MSDNPHILVTKIKRIVIDLNPDDTFSVLFNDMTYDDLSEGLALTATVSNLRQAAMALTRTANYFWQHVDNAPSKAPK